MDGTMRIAGRCSYHGEQLITAFPGQQDVSMIYMRQFPSISSSANKVLWNLKMGLSRLKKKSKNIGQCHDERKSVDPFKTKHDGCNSCSSEHMISTAFVRCSLDVRTSLVIIKSYLILKFLNICPYVILKFLSALNEYREFVPLHIDKFCTDQSSRKKLDKLTSSMD